MRVGPCTACALLDGDAAAKSVCWMPCCAAWLCDRCAGDYPRRLAAMRARDGLAGGLVGWVRRVIA
jgi:hypothetical protein